MLILNSDDESIARESRIPASGYPTLNFPDGKTFGMGSQDNKIYLYDAERSFALKAKCEMHNSYITHFDFRLTQTTSRATAAGTSYFSRKFQTAATSIHRLR